MSYKLDTEAEVLNYSLSLDSLSTDAPMVLCSADEESSSMISLSSVPRVSSWSRNQTPAYHPEACPSFKQWDPISCAQWECTAEEWLFPIAHHRATKSSIQLWFEEVGFCNDLSLGGQRNRSSPPWLMLLFHVDFMFKVLSHILALQECKV